MINEELKKEFKEKLEMEKSKLEKELGKFAKPTENPSDFKTQFEDIGSDRDENATEVENYSDSVALESNLEGQLRSSIEALEKMKKGNYGVCENCEKEIDIERLKAYPAAKTCVECK